MKVALIIIGGIAAFIIIGFLGALFNKWWYSKGPVWGDTDLSPETQISDITKLRDQGYITQEKYEEMLEKIHQTDNDNLSHLTEADIDNMAPEEMKELLKELIKK